MTLDESSLQDAARADRQFRDAPVLITGGLGFIGSNLAIALVKLGAAVTIVDSLVPQHGGNLFNVSTVRDRVTVHLAEVEDEERLRDCVRGRRFVFNLVGQTSHLDSMSDPLTDLKANCTAQLALLESVRRNAPGARVVFASTRQVYGRPRSLPVDETHPLRPVDVNGIHKVAAEEYHRLYADAYGLRTFAVRLTNTFGPRMRIRDARQTFLGVWIRDALQGRPFEVWGGGQLRDLVYVDDVVDALLLAAASDTAPGGVYNVGGPEHLSLSELAKKLAEISGAAYVRVPFPEERQAIDIGDYYADDTLFRHTFGWTPRVSLAEGLKRTVDFYRTFIGEYS